MRICVTGASGKAGRATVAELLGHGHEVIATDLVPPGEDIGVNVVLADLTDYGQTVDVLRGSDSVVHLANIPAPDIRPPVETFNTNATMNFNVFYGAAQLGLRRVVWASSETTLGLPFDEPPRHGVPARARGADRRCGELHHRGGGHRDEPTDGGAVTTNARAPESRIACRSRGLRRIRSSFIRITRPSSITLADPDLVLDKLFCLRVALRERLNDEPLCSKGGSDYVPAEAPIEEELGRRLSRSASSAHGEGLPRPLHSDRSRRRSREGSRPPRSVRERLSPGCPSP